MVKFLVITHGRATIALRMQFHAGRKFPSSKAARSFLRSIPIEIDFKKKRKILPNDIPFETK